MAGLRFTGADNAACAAAWHKGRAQAVLGTAGLPVVKRVLWRPGTGEVPEGVKRLVAADPGGDQAGRGRLQRVGSPRRLPVATGTRLLLGTGLLPDRRRARHPRRSAGRACPAVRARAPPVGPGRPLGVRCPGLGHQAAAAQSRAAGPSPGAESASGSAGVPGRLVRTAYWYGMGTSASGTRLWFGHDVLPTPGRVGRGRCVAWLPYRNDIHEAFLTLGRALLCWRRLSLQAPSPPPGPAQRQPGSDHLEQCLVDGEPGGEFTVLHRRGQVRPQLLPPARPHLGHRVADPACVGRLTATPCGREIRCAVVRRTS